MKPYGKMPDGTQVDEYTLTNDNGMSMKVITLGGIVTEIHVPDRNGKLADVCLGCSNLEEYLEGHPYFGSIVGRVGNRIAKGKFALGGKEYISSLFSVSFSTSSSTISSSTSRYWTRISHASSCAASIRSRTSSSISAAMSSE